MPNMVHYFLTRGQTTHIFIALLRGILKIGDLSPLAKSTHDGNDQTGVTVPKEGR